MSLRLPDHWIWDAWYAVDSVLVHAFFLHAPRSLGDPDLRHAHARIGHAVSADLRTWRFLGEALGPGPDGSFDDLATWTGSVIRDGDGWLMAYSGVARAEAGQVQRIGFARSADLVAWERTGPVLEADPRWYETAGPAEVHWRDPWAFRTDDGILHLLITARVPDGPDLGRGVIAHAWSADGGASFEVGPPVSAPGELRQVEVPQLLRTADNRWIIVASSQARDHSDARRARPAFVAETGTLLLEGPTALGPFKVLPGRFLDGDPAGRRYAGRVVELGGRLHLMTWASEDAGAFSGELADPIPLDIDADGRLVVAVEARA